MFTRRLDPLSGIVFEADGGAAAGGAAAGAGAAGAGAAGGAAAGGAAAGGAAGGAGAAGADDAAKFRRLFEGKESEAKELKKKLDALEAARAADDEKGKTEAQKTAERLEALETRAKKAERDALVMRVAAKHKLEGDAIGFLAGETEEEVEASAAKLAGLLKAAAPAEGNGTTTSVTVGTQTRPGATPNPAIDEKIAAAYKAGDGLEAIRLKRLKAFGGGVEGG